MKWLKTLFWWFRVLFPKQAQEVREIANETLGQISVEEADRRGVEEQRIAKARRKHGLAANPKTR